ncbi:MAG: ROK family protein [Armatimonadota bacterium]|nr:ROK family protein [Armatimonadota bacterium]
MDITIGLDIGGTKIMVAAADGAGTILRRTRADTPLDLTEGLALLKRLTEEVQETDRIVAIGAAAGGPLDWKTGVVSPLHQPQWRDVPLKAIFEREYGCPFFVDVDTNAAALGEWRYGGREPGGLLYLTLSTGMGGGLLRDGQLYRGKDGTHPEAAHQSVPFRCAHPERVACECGAPDCLEALVSGNGIRRVYGKPAEELAEDEWAEVAYNLGLGLRNLAVILAPDVIVLGGGVAVGGGEAFVAEAGRVMAERLFLTPTPALRLSRLGYDTALLGAITLAQQGLESLS